MPGTYEKGKFDIAGFAVGIVGKNKILNKNKIKKNNLILAVPSSGLHSNGYSLVRYLIKQKKININKNKFLKSELLKPTKIYVKEIMNLINKNLINGCANITGGGLADNIKRVIPDKFSANINRSLEYYSGMVFNITVNKNKKQNVLLSGGRYDGLLKNLGSKKDTTAVGAAIDMSLL